MPAPKRKATKKEDKDLQRAAQRAWMIDQKRNVNQEEEVEEPVPVAEENKDEDIKDSEVDSGVEDNNDSIENEEEMEEDGPLENWTLKELKEECKTLGLADKGKKAELIERIREARSAAAAPVSEVETAIEKVAEEVNEEESTKEDEPAEVAVEENEPE